MSDAAREDRPPAGPAPHMVVVGLPAEIDVSNEPQVRTALANALARGPRVVIANGTRTRFCDCAAVATLISLHHQAAEAGAQLRVVIASEQVHRTLDLTGADDLLRLYPSLDAAQAADGLPPEN